MRRVVAIAVFAALAMSHGAPGGTIVGTVVQESDGTPIADARIEAWDYDTGETRGTDYTSPPGLYTISGLPAGRYKVKALHWMVDYVHEYYDNAVDDQDATPVVVPANGVVQGIDFRLILGGSIVGVVTDATGAPIPDLLVTAADYDTGRYRGEDTTDADGLYVIRRLPGGRFRVRVGTQGTDFISEFYDDILDQDLATPVVVPATRIVQNVNFVLAAGGLRVSGRITGKDTHLPLPNVLVGYWHDDFKIYVTDYTDTAGRYELTGLVPGLVGIGINPAYYYARMGTHLDLRASISNLDFALPEGASISGTVVDAGSAKRLAGILINYWCDQYRIWSTDYSKEDGTFLLRNLPPGLAQIEALPDAKLGYLPQPEDSTKILLGEGQDVTGRVIRLSRGALVSGLVRDSQGQPLPYFECDYSGRLCDADVETDSAGRYQIRLPVGICVIAADEEDFGALPVEVAVSDVNLAVHVPDLIAYSEQTGSRISGFVDGAGDLAGTEEFEVVAFKAGTAMDVNGWHTARSVRNVDLVKEGPFALTALPPSVPYDVVLVVGSETDDGMESYTLMDWKLSVPAGDTGVRLHSDTSGSEVYGNVIDTGGQALLGATVLLCYSATGRLAASACVDYYGRFEMYHIKPGTYLATALHSGYVNTPSPIQVFSGLSANVGTIAMPPTGPLSGR